MKITAIFTKKVAESREVVEYQKTAVFVM